MSVAPALNPQEPNTHQPRTVLFNYSGANHSGFSTSDSHVETSGVQWPLRKPFDTFMRENIHGSYPPDGGPYRTELLPAGRFQPYGMTRARLDRRSNAEAGPSNLVLPPTPYINQPSSQPPGGISEATADADTTITITEEDRAAVSNFYCSHIPRVTEWSFGVRSPNGPGSPAAKGGHAHPAY